MEKREMHRRGGALVRSILRWIVGPKSCRAEYRRRVAAALAQPLNTAIISDADLAVHSAAVAAYVRRAVGKGTDPPMRIPAQVPPPFLSRRSGSL
jgi:hypothetical protein